MLKLKSLGGVFSADEEDKKIIIKRNRQYDGEKIY